MTRAYKSGWDCRSHADDYAEGLEAWKSLSRYRRKSVDNLSTEKASFVRGFLERCCAAGLSDEQIKCGIDALVGVCGSDVCRDLHEGLEKTAIPFGMLSFGTRRLAGSSVPSLVPSMTRGLDVVTKTLPYMMIPGMGIAAPMLAQGIHGLSGLMQRATAAKTLPYMLPGMGIAAPMLAQGIHGLGGLMQRATAPYVTPQLPPTAVRSSPHTTAASMNPDAGHQMGLTQGHIGPFRV